MLRRHDRDILEIVGSFTLVGGSKDWHRIIADGE